MDIVDFFQPIEISKFNGSARYPANALGSIFAIHTEETGFPSLDNIQLAILGVEEDRKAVNNTGCGAAPDYIREKLYQLYQGNYKVKAADLGNIKKGFEMEDSYFALTNVCCELLRNGIIPIIIGGGNDLVLAAYHAYAKLEQTINMVSVDAMLDLGETEEDLNSRSYLGKIILQQPNFLFNYSNIGYQTYFIDQTSIELMAKLYFDTYRLGQVQSNIEEVEPVIRNADMLSFDISAIRMSEAPANGNASPNGFYGEEACRIARYAGLSDKLTSVGFYELNPAFDRSNQTAHLVAQMLWYFIDGFYNRKSDFPHSSNTDYTKYRVSIKDHKYEIVFYKSNKSDRWWMDVPYPVNKKVKYERHHLVPCSYNDYHMACNEEMPDRWWQTYQKLG